jgi:hypothetical protein
MAWGSHILKLCPTQFQAASLSSRKVKDGSDSNNCHPKIHHPHLQLLSFGWVGNISICSTVANMDILTLEPWPTPSD